MDRALTATGKCRLQAGIRSRRHKDGGTTPTPALSVLLLQLAL